MESDFSLPPIRHSPLTRSQNNSVLFPKQSPPDVNSFPVTRGPHKSISLTRSLLKNSESGSIGKLDLPGRHEDDGSGRWANNKTNDGALLKKIKKTRYTDFITIDRLRHPVAQRSAFTDFYKLNMSSLQNELKETLDGETGEMEDSPFAQEMAEELRRKDFEEFIILRSTNTMEMGHLYLKILKLFRLISVTNEQGTLIVLLSLIRLVKRSPEVVQAVEESDGIVVLLNLLECKVTTVQLATMKLLASLFQVMYLRRMAIAYGAVQVLVDLLLETEDDITAMASDLLASLALLKEATGLISKTKGIQHLVCLLNVTSSQTKAAERQILSRDKRMRRHSLSAEVDFRMEEDAARSDRVLISVATALWRFSHSPTNRKIMQRAGIMLIIRRLIHRKNEKLLVPILGILQGCANDAAFRLSIRTEGILKFLIDHLDKSELHVKLQCSKTLYFCVDDDQTKEAVRTLNGIEALASIVKSQTAEASQLLRLGWLDFGNDRSTVDRMSYREENTSAAEGSGKSPETPGESNVRISRLRLSGPGGTQIRSASGGSRSSIGKEDDSLTFQLLHTVLATLWKCCSLRTNLLALYSTGATEYVIKIVDLLPPYLTKYRQPLCVISPRLQKISMLERVCAIDMHCLARLAQHPKVHRDLLGKVRSLKNLITLLSHFSTEILIPTISAIASMAVNAQLAEVLTGENCFRYLFSLSFHSDSQVRKAALRAVHAFLKNADDKTALLRPVSSSLGYFIQALSNDYYSLLKAYKKSTEELEELLSTLCLVVAEIASAEPGRSVLAELGIVPFLVHITAVAKMECLQVGVSAAITQFASIPNMIKAFREKEFLGCLIEFVRKGGPELQFNAVRALDILSADQTICSTIRSLDITSVFLQLTCTGSHELQEAAAHVIGRMARLNLSPARVIATVSSDEGL
ncbi:unnamed protein product [Calicophoron daubneyi]|uniref:Uncharacterized protein n=1 Tax=Calicophoron daubneyi TaxID=300641 RepID=A0AAV2TM37_CALDB